VQAPEPDRVSVMNLLINDFRSIQTIRMTKGKKLKSCIATAIRLFHTLCMALVCFIYTRTIHLVRNKWDYLVE
jgi:hypothetical protein